MTKIIEKESITFRIREDWRELIDRLVTIGVFDSISDCLRKSVRNTLIEHGLIDGLAESSNEEEKEDTSNGLEAHEEVSKIEQEAQTV